MFGSAESTYECPIIFGALGYSARPNHPDNLSGLIAYKPVIFGEMCGIIVLARDPDEQ